jgi:neutral amino acid transport system ATP-binding protein
MEPLLSITDLTAGYGDADVLHGIELHVHDREMVAIVGPNGAGKSTVLNAVMGLIRIGNGDIRFKGESLLGRVTESLREMGISYVPQVANVFPSLTVEENIIVGMSKGPELATRIQEIMGMFPALGDRFRMMAGQLSGGERQMLAFARGLVSRPSLLLLDEPSAALSPLLSQTIFEKIRHINEAGNTILLVEQNVRRALETCHRGYLLDSGRNALSGKGSELLCHPHMAALYLGGAKTHER